MRRTVLATRGVLAALALWFVCAASCAAPQGPEVVELYLEPLSMAEPPGPNPTLRPDGANAPLALRLGQAVLQALENNRALRVERMQPAVRRTFEQEERAAFDPVLAAEAFGTRETIETAAGNELRVSETGGGAGVSAFLPTGTNIEVGATTRRSWGDRLTEQHATRAGITVTQALLRGGGIATNLVGLRQARLDTLLTGYELRGFAEGLVATVEHTYWDYVLARRRVEIVEESLNLAEQQLKETRQRIEVGSLAETELAAAQAEVALRREALINANSRVNALRVRLVRLIRPGDLAEASRLVLPLTAPAVPEVTLDPVDDHVALALRMRPDLNQARLLVQRGDLQLTRTRNGLLPQMDLFVSLGATGYARSFGASVGDIGNDGYDVGAGLSFEFPAVNRGARARHERATISHKQLGQSLLNVEDLVREDVELAYIEVRRTREQVAATTATRQFQEEKLRAETAKFSVGKSTAILVAAAQRDLVASRVAEVEAVTDHLKSLTTLYRLDGSLLVRRGISAPAGQAAPETAWRRDGGGAKSVRDSALFAPKNDNKVK